MMNRRGWSALALAGVLLTAAPAAAGFRFGVEGAGSGVFPAGNYLASGGKEFQNGKGYNLRASLVMGPWFFSYDYTAITNTDCGACAPADFGTTKFHSFTANYHFYFMDKPIRPYLLIGLGAVFGTVGTWPLEGQGNNVFGADLRAGFGIEIPIGGHVFISIEGRYRYLLTNNPMQDLQQTVLDTFFQGGNANDLFKEAIQDAHMIQAILGLGFHF